MDSVVGGTPVGGWEPAQVVKAAPQTFLERWQLQPPSTQPAISASCVCTEKLSCTGCLFMAGSFLKIIFEIMTMRVEKTTYSRLGLETY